jgi:hypothetical protein
MFGQGEIASLVAAVLKLASNHIRRRCWRPENRQAQRLSLSTVNFAKLRFSTCRAWQNSPDGSLNCSHRHGYLQELSIRKNTLEKVDGVARRHSKTSLRGGTLFIDSPLMIRLRFRQPRILSNANNICLSQPIGRSYSPEK